MSMEVMELVWQNVCIRNKVKSTATKSFLHLDVVETQPVLSRDLVRLWKVIDSLVLIQALVKI